MRKDVDEKFVQLHSFALEKWKGFIVAKQLVFMLTYKGVVGMRYPSVRKFNVRGSTYERTIEKDCFKH